MSAFHPKKTLGPDSLSGSFCPKAEHLLNDYQCKISGPCPIVTGLGGSWGWAVSELRAI
jgi:hypothetical protein